MIINHAFSSAYFAGDVNIDGRKDISDLLYLVDYFFKQPPGPAPPEPMFADCNNSGLLDISDLLMMVDYYFGTGEPCSLE